MSRQVSRPPIPGMFMSSSTRSNLLEAQLLERRFTGLRVVDLVSLAGQRDVHHPADLRIIIDDENASRAHRQTLHAATTA